MDYGRPGIVSGDLDVEQSCRQQQREGSRAPSGLQLHPEMAAFPNARTRTHHSLPTPPRTQQNPADKHSLTDIIRG
jgi:hypothetical protein